MAFDIDLEHAYNVAIRIEENGINFYRKAATIVDDPDIKKLLQSLADWENEHKVFFIKCKDDISDLNPLDYRQYLQKLYEPTVEEAENIKLMADSSVFPMDIDLTERLQADVSLESILRMALDIEKDAVIFYLNIRDAMKASSESDALSKIIKEEMRHIAVLNRELAACRVD
jgi:rubrerythrin